MDVEWLGRFPAKHAVHHTDNDKEPDSELLEEFRQLWAEADRLWDEHEKTPAFAGYVSADYQAIYVQLQSLRGQAWSFLEWGSGMGIVTIMASRMGFDAYGIEVEPNLVVLAERLAADFQCDAQFAVGSFVPDDFDWNPAAEDVHRTVIDAASGYDELEMQLDEFDVVYAYPWPDEHGLFRSIMRQFGQEQAMLMTYDVREGVEMLRPGSTKRR